MRYRVISTQNNIRVCKSPCIAFPAVSVILINVCKPRTVSDKVSPYTLRDSGTGLTV